MNEPQILFSTIDDETVAREIAESLVAEKLAACVNIIPGLFSIYRWKEQIERETELLLMIKTTSDRVEALTRKLQELHPYDVPELIALPVSGGLPDYLDWIRSQTR